MENNEKKPEKQELTGGAALPICMCLGMSIGCAIGILLEQMALGICLGMTVGIAAGVGISSLRARKQKKDREEEA